MKKFRNALRSVSILFLVLFLFVLMNDSGIHAEIDSELKVDPTIKAVEMITERNEDDTLNPQEDADLVHQVLYGKLAEIAKTEGVDSTVRAINEAKNKMFYPDSSIGVSTDENLVEGFSGSYYVGNELYILVSTDEMEEVVYRSLEELPTGWYKVLRVTHDYRALEIALMEYLATKPTFIDASIDVVNNQVVVGLQAERFDTHPQMMKSSNGVTIEFKASDAEGWVTYDEPIQSVDYVEKTEVENNTHAETLSESSSIAATFELWGGDAIGSFSAWKGTISIPGTWDGKPAILTAGHVVTPGVANYYYNTSNVRQTPAIGTTLYAYQSFSTNVGHIGDYAVVQRNNGIGTNKVLTGVNPLASELITGTATKTSLGVNKLVRASGAASKGKSINKILGHVILYSADGGYANVIKLAYDGIGPEIGPGDSGGPVWINYGTNYYAGLVVGGNPATGIWYAYPHYDLYTKTNGRFVVQTSP